MTAINQKDYLKKYLSKNVDKKKKKKKKAPKGIHHNVIIIDDNVDAYENQQTINDIQNESEDAPQIVGVIDERPVELRLQQFKDRSSWTFNELKPVIKIEPDESPPTDENNTSPRNGTETHVNDTNVHRKKEDDDNSPPRRTNRDNSGDISPPRRNRRHKEDSTSSRRDLSPRRRNSRWESEETRKKATKTLDGKTAGLQNARDLISETKKLKKREERVFDGMCAEVTGANAETIIRDRKTGKVRNLEEEAKEKSEQEKRRKEAKQKYDMWGKGVKQVEDYQRKLAEDAHEINKPLARYADDDDLQQYQKDRERDGDPMLDYIRKRKREDAKKAGIELKPQYHGEFAPNRFGIRPGHRWDGVKRSNGYEEKWFKALNERNAQQDEVYKWNTEDM